MQGREPLGEVFVGRVEIVYEILPVVVMADVVADNAVQLLYLFVYFHRYLSVLQLFEAVGYVAEDLGRATKGAAQAMLCKVYLYNKDYDNAYVWGKRFREEQYGKEYTLCSNYSDNFTLAGENGPESVFEIQYMEDPTSDYGEGFGFTRGTFTTILTRPRCSELSSRKGWGWNHPTRDLYAEFEQGDPRREATVGIPSEAAQLEVEVNYLGSPYYNNKTAYCENGDFPSLSHDSRSPMNYRLVRASDVLLLYAEAALESGKDVAGAKWALNYSPNAPYQDPCKWMDEFVALVGPDAFDYTAIHVYGGYGVLTDLATKFHDKYGKDVWVTEFCYWPEAGNQNSSVTPSTQINFMTQALEWLETTPWIHKYAWFKAKGGYNSNKGPNYGLIIPQTGYDERKLSPQGLVYCYMSDFDREVWNAVGTEFPAVDYVASNAIELYPGNDAGCAKPIEISRFNSGSTVDWQFDVPEAGRYDLKLTVAGMGEPVRFDPQLKVQLVNGDEVTDLTDVVGMTLPNSDEKYEARAMNVTLPAGHVTLRLADAAPYQPSGIRISRVGLYAEGTGAVEGVAMETLTKVNVYNMQGVMLKRNVDPATAIDGLAPGLYIIGNRKVLIK